MQRKPHDSGFHVLHNDALRKQVEHRRDSVFNRCSLGMVNDNHVDWTLSRPQGKAELLLDRCEEFWVLGGFA